MSFRMLADIPDAAQDALLDAAFGPDRRQRTAYKVRRGCDMIEKLSIAWHDVDGLLTGIVQCWPVALRADEGVDRPMIMVGPVAVLPERQNEGIGIALMDRVMSLHDGWPVESQVPMMMIGDAAYYGRWNFSADHTGRWRLPGPFERDRLLMRWHRRGDLDFDGEIGPRR